MSELAELPQGSPYRGYTYAYPHKTAYRPFTPPVPLSALWAAEPRDALFLYLHVPFCERRCGYCNLFSLAGPDRELAAAYLAALERQARAVRAAIPDARFSRLAFGGGTPSLLAPAELERLFALCAEVMGADAGALPTSVEVSPGTVTAEKLAVLRGHGVSRVSVGIQSFDDAENRWLGRRQTAADAHAALRLIRDAGFPVLNVDLIYGGAPQTPASWRRSLDAALAYAPEELYLYPLYVRPRTGLHRRDAGPDIRPALYQDARALLLARGYTQVSMRMFRAPHAPAEDGPAYCCQRDGMIGLGCGARSYTAGVHYGTAYAVTRPHVREILATFIARDAAAFAHAHHGFVLDDDERRRRFLLKSLLRCAGLRRDDFRAACGVDPVDAFPAVRQLAAQGWADITPACIRLTDAGIARSDAIGPWLYSPRVVALIEAHPCR